MTAKKKVSAQVPGKLAQEIERKRDSRRILALQRQRPDLEIVEVPRDARMRVQEIQEEASADMLEVVEEAARELGISGQGYTFQVSEGVFTRPKQERPPQKPGRRSKP
jgi:hypothetical protein